jgi:hypothetical protein
LDKQLRIAVANEALAAEKLAEVRAAEKSHSPKLAVAKERAEVLHKQVKKLRIRAVAAEKAARKLSKKRAAHSTKHKALGSFDLTVRRGAHHYVFAGNGSPPQTFDLGAS